MNIYGRLKHKYKDLLKDSSVPLMQARLRILAYGLIFLIIVCTVILGLLLMYPKPAIIFRLLVLLLTLIYAFYLLLYKGQWRRSAHIMLITLCLFVWTNIILYQYGINLVTFQLTLIVISASFYILGKNWGLIYSITNVIPIIIYLFFSRLQDGHVYLTQTQTDSNTFMLALISFFVLIIMMNHEFFKSFYQTHVKERELNRKLQVALSEAQEATRMRSDFLSSMSHELRTPLHAVIGLINVLSVEKPRKDQEENLAILRFSAENLLALINDTLDFSKMNADKVLLNKAKFNLNLLLQNIFAAHHAKVQQKNINLQLDMDFENSVHVIGDQTRLTQILNNLISNAIKFTDAEGLVEISVKTKSRNEKSILLLFSIRDTGIGIPKNKHDIIFEPFLQANNNITKRYGGTGLGLAIVKRLIELHDSSLKLQSEENKGSVFSFEISYDLAIVEELPPVTAAHQNNVIDISALNILIAEDNIINIMLLKKILDQWNCNYSIANNGLEALEMVKPGTFDVVLMDIHMPVMDGFEASRQIRELPDVKVSKIKIIALTASSAVDIQQSFSYAYLDDYLTKPFSPHLLKEKLEVVVKQLG
jgi:signal transduction histidine kinase